MQNSNEEDLKKMLRMQTTETTQQPTSDVRSSELLTLSQTCGLQRNRSGLFWAFWNLQPDQHSHESLLLPINLSDDTSRSYRSDQEIAKGIMHNGIPTILQPTRSTGNNWQWQRFKFHQYSKDLPGKQFTNTELKKYAESKKITRKFIPSGAPHFGGTWEHLIGMSKRLFFNITGSRKLQEDCFSTLICQVEALLNSRPLTSASSDMRDVESLTQGHFWPEWQQD